MLASFIISLREGIEISLIFCTILVVLKKIGTSKLIRSMWMGGVSAGIVSLVFGAILFYFGKKFEQSDLFKLIIVITGATLITWVLFWINNNARNLKNRMQESSFNGKLGFFAVFVLAFITVLREGIEIVVFVLPIAFIDGIQSSLLATLVGLVLAFVIGAILFFTTKMLPLKVFFKTTTVLLVIFAAGLLASGAKKILTLTGTPKIPLWDSSWFIENKSITGRMVSAIVGYNATPTALEIIFYFGYIAIIIAILQYRKLKHKTS